MRTLSQACKMEILFEFQGSRRMLKPQSSEAIVELVLAELKKFDQDAFILCGSGGDNDSGPSDAKPHVCYLLQNGHTNGVPTWM